MKSVFILRSNAVDPDPRVEKIAKWLFEAGWRVSILAWDRERKSSCIEKKWYATIHRVHIPGMYGGGFKNLFPLLLWNIFIFLKLMVNVRRFTHIHACDFDTVLPAFLVAKLTRKKIVYDVFDFYSDSMLIRAPKMLKLLIKRIDFWIMEKVDAVIIADDSRRRQIYGAQPRRLEVIYNVPELIIDDNNQFKYYNLGNYKLVVAYIGILQEGRGLLEVINLVARNPKWKLILGGFGSIEKIIKQKIKDVENIEFIGRTPYEKTLSIYSISDIILALYDPSIPNHKYASPNKLFEAMMLGKPIIVAKDTGVDKIVKQYNLGFVVDYGNLHQLEKAFYEVASWSIQKRKEFAICSKMVYDQFFSPKEMKTRLLNLYNLVGGE